MWLKTKTIKNKEQNKDATYRYTPPYTHRHT